MAKVNERFMKQMKDDKEVRKIIAVVERELSNVKD